MYALRLRLLATGPSLGGEVVWAVSCVGIAVSVAVDVDSAGAVDALLKLLAVGTCSGTCNFAGDVVVESSLELCSADL